MSFRSLSRASRVTLLSCFCLIAGCETPSGQKGVSETAKKLPGPQLNWKAGTVAVFEVQLDMATASTTSPLPQEMRVLGRLALRSEPRAEGLRLVAQLFQVRVLDHKGNTIDEAGVLVGELEQPFGAEYKDGLIARYRQPRATTFSSVGIRRQILAAFQLAQADKEGVRFEWDGTGKSEVHYKPQSGATSTEGTWSWNKKRYLEVLMTQSGSAKNDRYKLLPEMKRGEGTLLLKAGEPTEIQRNERIEVEVSEGLRMSVTTALSLKRVQGSKQSPPTWQTLTKSTRPVPVGRSEPIKDTRLVDSVKRGTLKMEEALKLITGPTSPENMAEKSVASRAIVSMLRSEPTTVSVFLKRLSQGDKASLALLDLLGSASTPRAIDILSEMALNKKLETTVRLRAATGLIRAQWPNEKSLDTVIVLSREPKFREHGLLGVGTFIRRWRQAGEREWLKKGVEFLRKEFDASVAKDDPVPALLGIANSGSALFFDDVLPLQSHPKKGVRDAAIQAIRLMKDKRVEPRLRELLARKKAEDLRSALHAISRIKPKDHATILAAITLVKHTNADVRREAVLALKTWEPDWPEVTPVLKEVRAKETDKRVLQAAAPTR